MEDVPKIVRAVLGGQKVYGPLRDSLASLSDGASVNEESVMCGWKTGELVALGQI